MAFFLDIEKKLAPIVKQVEPKLRQVVDSAKKIDKLVCSYVSIVDFLIKVQQQPVSALEEEYWRARDALLPHLVEVKHKLQVDDHTTCG